MPRLVQVEADARPLVPRWARRLLGPAWLLGLWVVLAETGAISEKSFAPPHKVWSAFVELVGDGELQHHLWISLHRA